MAYATTTELTAYATARGVTLVTDLDVLLTKAHDYIETFSYQGKKTVSTQADEWPRDNVVINDIYLVDGTTPQGIKNAEMQTAIDIEAGDNPLDSLGRSVKSQKVDVIETVYMEGTRESVYLKLVNSLLKPYLSNQGVGIKRV
jgi:hypothetical protein